MPGNHTPLILVTNDDGIRSSGLHALTSIMQELGDVVVVAPMEEQSGTSSALTVHRPVRIIPWSLPLSCEEDTVYAVTGTPTDCVKLALSHLLSRTPDLVVSGINHGWNTAINTIYSGTVGAVLEAAIAGVAGIAFSLCSKDAVDFFAARQYIKKIAQRVLENVTPGVFFNVNIPALPAAEIRGIAFTRLADSRWIESFIRRQDPMGRPYYWLSGTFVNLDVGENSDIEAIGKGMISVTPLQYDMTAYSVLEQMQSWEQEVSTESSGGV